MYNMDPNAECREDYETPAGDDFPMDYNVCEATVCDEIVEDPREAYCEHCLKVFRGE